MAANRADSIPAAMRRVWARGGLLGCEYYEDSDGQLTKAV
jgi:hypothetical protein